MLSALLAGIFFVLSAYTETLGFHSAGLDLGSTEAPLRVLAALVHLPALGVIIDVGLCIGLFACTLACITAAARIMLLMAHKASRTSGCCAAPIQSSMRRWMLRLSPARW